MSQGSVSGGGSGAGPPLPSPAAPSAAGRAGVADRGGNGAPSGSHGGASRPSAISRSKAISMSQTGSKPGGGMAKHEGPAAAHYWLPRPAFGGSAGNRRMSRPGFEAPAEPERHQRYSEHPFLLQKDTRNIPNIGKICLSFGVHPQVRDFRHHEDDRDTNNGRCKFVRDCRLHDGPDHTDPKPCRIRDRLDEQGRPVLHAAAENVPHDQINERKYIVIGKPDHKHHYRKPPPPFKGAGGARVGWGRDDRVVDVNLGHGHGVFAHQQHIGPEGRLPFGQQQRKVPLTDSRRAMVQRAWAVLAGTLDSPKITRGRLLGCLKTRMLHSVVSQQQTEQQAQDEVLERMIGSSDPEQGSGEVTYQDFENFWQARSADITDDGYFALVLHNHFALK